MKWNIFHFSLDPLPPLRSEIPSYFWLHSMMVNTSMKPFFLSEIVTMKSPTPSPLVKNISLHWLQGIFETVPKRCHTSALLYYTILYTQARIQFVRGGGGWSPPPQAVCNFVLLVDLPRALQQFGSAPEIPVRTPPPPPSECTETPFWILDPRLILYYTIFDYILLYASAITSGERLRSTPELML